MLKSKKTLNNCYKIYSDTHKQIKHIKSGETHSEYVVKDEPNLSDYKEVDE